MKSTSSALKASLLSQYMMVMLIVEDASHSSNEIRLHALGQTDAGRLLHISFTLRGNGKLIEIISARTMHRKERFRYDQEG